MHNDPDMNWFVVPLNGVGWRVGPITVGRSGAKKLFPIVGKDQELAAYQEAVRDQIFMRYGRVPVIEASAYELVFYFSQVLVDHVTPTGRKSRKKPSDLTNLVKATEDAIQGVLIENDVKVERQTNYVERSDSGVPFVLIGVRPYSGINPDELPTQVWFAITELKKSEIGAAQTPLYNWADDEEVPF